MIIHAIAHMRWSDKSERVEKHSQSNKTPHAIVVRHVILSPPFLSIKHFYTSLWLALCAIPKFWTFLTVSFHKPLRTSRINKWKNRFYFTHNYHSIMNCSKDTVVSTVCCCSLKSLFFSPETKVTKYIPIPDLFFSSTQNLEGHYQTLLGISSISDLSYPLNKQLKWKKPAKIFLITFLE